MGPVQIIVPKLVSDHLVTNSDKIDSPHQFQHLFFIVPVCLK